MFDGSGQIDLDGAAATGVAAASSVLATMASIPGSVLSDDALASATLVLEEARRFLDAAELMWLAELDRRGVTEAEFGQRSAAWLAHEANLPRAVATARVTTARKVTGELAGVGDALREGSIGFDHARVLADVANPRNIDGLAGVTGELCDAAQLASFSRWQAEVRGLAAQLDADGGHDPAGDLPEPRLRARRVGDVTVVDGQLVGDGAHIAESALDQIADELFRRYARDAEVTGRRGAASVSAVGRGVRRVVSARAGGRRRWDPGAQDGSDRGDQRGGARPGHRRVGSRARRHDGVDVRSGAAADHHELRWAAARAGS